MYEKIFNILAKLFGLKVEKMVLRKPLGAEYWAYSDKQDYVYQLYVTNYKKDKQSGSFGFWVYDEKLSNVYKKAFDRSIPNLKWVVKNKYKWLKGKL